jgi:hypothetical protein
MRFLILGLLAVAVCSGSICGVPGPNTFDRLAVNDHLRAACAGWMDTDIDIETMLSLGEQGRLDGMAYGDLLNSVIPICTANDPDTNNACWTCNTAVLDQLYGR